MSAEPDRLSLVPDDDLTRGRNQRLLRESDKERWIRRMIDAIPGRMTMFVETRTTVDKDGRRKGILVKTTLHYQPTTGRRQEIVIDRLQIDQEPQSVVNAVWRVIERYHLASKITVMMINHGNNTTEIVQAVGAINAQCRQARIPFKTEDNRLRYMRRLAVRLRPPPSGKGVSSPFYHRLFLTSCLIGPELQAESMPIAAEEGARRAGMRSTAA
ncbi:hypothetical protein PQX77_008166 [Marasmius sp. AFHP31]|nr:hypothetical protein PQX77_008166 [Marasmius sp. AFHP31]